MDFNRQNIFQATAAKKTVVWDEGLRSYMLKIYNYMATGVLLIRYCTFLFRFNMDSDVSSARGGVLHELWNKQNECC